MVIGLTGGIATGKTIVSNMFQQLGLAVIDADIIAHQQTMPETEGYQLIVRQFGSEILRDDQYINRQLLGSIVFNDPTKRTRLNQLLHPVIFAEIEQQKQAVLLENPVVMIVVPLLLEVDNPARYNQIIVAYARPETQLARLMKRDGLTENEAAMRIAAQLPIDSKKRLGTVLDTEKNLGELRNDIKEIYNQLPGANQT